MVTFLEYAFLFFVGAISGWVIELLFRRFFTAKKWINPGFLTGPYLPLYGFGLCVLHLFCQIDLSFMALDQPWEAIVRILIITVILTLVEYLAGLIFIKGMNIKLWDYSNRFGNIQGIICPLFTLFWGVGSALYLWLLEPSIGNIVIWFNNNLTFSFFVGIFFGLIIVDFAISMNLSVKLRKIAKDLKIVLSYEKLKETVKEHLSETSSKKHFFFFFKTPFSLVETVTKYVETISEKVKNIVDKKDTSNKK